MDSPESSTPIPATLPALEVPPTSPASGNAAAPTSPRVIRLVELGLLLAVAFGTSLYGSIAVLFNLAVPYGPAGDRWLYSLVHELTALALCAYLLHKQGRSFRDLGMNFQWMDPVYGICLMVLGLLATYALVYGLYFAGYYSPAARASHTSVISQMIGPAITWTMVVFTVVNGFFEELIVRAYLMTDVRSLTGSATLAVVLSAGFQGAYHLYQGWQSAAAVTAGFLVFSLFYAWTRRVTPLILTHILWDLCMLASYNYAPGRSGQ